MRRFIAKLAWHFSDAEKIYQAMKRQRNHKETQLLLLKRLDPNIKKLQDHKKLPLTRKGGGETHKKYQKAIRQIYNEMTPIELWDPTYTLGAHKEPISLFHPSISSLKYGSILEINQHEAVKALQLTRKNLKAIRINGPITDAKKSQLEQYFSCPAYLVVKNGNQYIAHSCSEGKLHYEPSAYIIEYLKDSKPVQVGELGEIFFTDLHQKTIIRRSTGLCGRFSSKCKCNSSLPVIGTIEGDSNNCISNRGHIITSLMPAELADQYDWVDRIKLVQQKKELMAEIQVCFKPTNNSLNRLTKDIAKLTHIRNIVLSVVDRVDPTPIVGINPFNNQ
ncbi:hypothetical protein K9M79_08505 [Candidatus Woesearchaeota archaeon]|nr:hypothetical protein [Candidatus Woesearchaeota archaeon]